MRHVVYAGVSLILCDCAMRASEIGQLQEMGFRQVTMRRAEDQKEDPNYRLWVKERANGARQVELCLVPQVPVAHYYWRVAVSVDGTVRWTSDNTVYGRGSNRLPVDCMTSGPLPAGRVSYETWFQYKPHGSSIMKEPATVEARDVDAHRRTPSSRPPGVGPPHP